MDYLLNEENHKKQQILFLSCAIAKKNAKKILRIVFEYTIHIDFLELLNRRFIMEGESEYHMFCERTETHFFKIFHLNSYNRSLSKESVDIFEMNSALELNELKINQIDTFQIQLHRAHILQHIVLFNRC